MVSPSGIRLNNVGGSFGHIPDPPEPQELSEQELIRSVLSDFYLTDHDFNVYVNKGCQTYDMTPEEMFDNAIVWEVYKEMQRGGCNEKRSNAENERDRTQDNR